jgi:hypothetical protein
MKRSLAVLALLLALFPGRAAALELKNVRPSYGPQGAERKTNKLLPGDTIWIGYEIEGLKVDAKTGKVKFDTKLELFEGKTAEPIYVTGPQTSDARLELGGTSMPGDLHIIMGPNRIPGKYTIKLTIEDKIAKDTKSFTYPVEVLPKDFGFVGVGAPTIGLAGQSYQAGFALVNMALDKKKQPDVEVVIKILEAGKAVTTPVHIRLTEELTGGLDLEKQNFVPLTYPLYLNRPGQFTLEITATDKAASKTIQLSYPLTVLDLAKFSGK